MSAPIAVREIVMDVPRTPGAVVIRGPFDADDTDADQAPSTKHPVKSPGGAAISQLAIGGRRDQNGF
jgi:hypothetical protein